MKRSCVFYGLAIVSIAVGCKSTASSGLGGAGGTSTQSSTGTVTHPGEECLSAHDEASCEAMGCIYDNVQKYPIHDLTCSAGTPDHVCTWHSNTGPQSPFLYFRDTLDARYVLVSGMGFAGGVVGFSGCACCTTTDPCDCLGN